MNISTTKNEYSEADQPVHYTFSNDFGDANLTVYQVFPGIELVYQSVHMDQFDLNISTSETLIEIHHCREGRIEQEFEDEFFYLTPGDLSVAIRSRPIRAYSFPLHHYHGITIAIDTSLAPKSFSCFLEGVAVEPLEVAQNLCQGRPCRLIRSEPYVEHIFSALYTVPEHIRKGFLQIKILELFQGLSGISPSVQPPAAHALSGLQVNIAKEAAAYLSAHMDQHITIAELSARFHISQTHLKQAFKGVYGVPVYSYMRIQKMHSAALKLIHTQRPVMEIASEYGYTNGSKFSSAFRDIMGETPSEYRKAHTKTPSL